MSERVSLEKAFEIIDKSVRPLDVETVEVVYAAGRVLAEKVAAWVELPNADISMLDGYAVRSEEVASAGPDNKVKLAVAGKSAANTPFEDVVPAGACVQVFSGSVVPQELDAVIGNERVEASEESIEASEPVSAGRHVRNKGEEFKVGESVANPGIVLDSGWIGLCVAAGWNEVKTVRMPRARVIAVGDEVMPLGRTLDPGEVYPSSASGIVGWLRKAGLSDVRMNLVLDDPFDLQEAVPRPHETDLIITLGGTGMSDHDVVIDSMAELSVELRFQGLAARPGHYTSFGMMEETPVLCLPGGPSAADMIFKLLGRRIVAALTAQMTRDLPINSAALAQDIPAKEGDFDRLIRVKFESSEEGIKAVPLAGRSLHKDIAESEGILRVPASESRAAGDRVEVWVTR